MRTITVLTVLLLIASCGKKTATETAAVAPPRSAFTAEMPDSPEAKKFAKQLTGSPLRGVSPTGSSNFNLHLTFAADGSFTSTGQAELGGETLECEEVGTWRIDSMDGIKANMDWTLAKTNCPNRENGSTQRVLLEFTADDFKISFR
ncbi:MAG: hypothetical protein GWP91_17430 [Rhodobacterales bacterium]|nr:hypothetical protein [Rhodobacterales bacterium]